MDSDLDLTLPETHLAVRWYPPSYDIRLERVPTPKIEHPDDAIVKIKFSGLCGSDLHVYRGHEDVDELHVCGHEFIGYVVALGSSFTSSSPKSRPALYGTLKVGDKVVSPFTTSCGECRRCRLGFTARCESSLLFGSPRLPGAQAQYARIPHAGGTLFALPTDTQSTLSNPSLSKLTALPDPTLILLADILPTGLSVALNALMHPKLAPILHGKAWPDEDRVLTVGVVGLGPVGLCAFLSLLDLLSNPANLATSALRFRLIAVDPNAARRAKLSTIIASLPTELKGSSRGEFEVCGIDEAKGVLERPGWGGGCDAVLEVVGNPSALTLSESLLSPSGVLSSCGVHQAPPVPFTGRDLYNASMSLEFGRCNVRSVFAMSCGVMARMGSDVGVVERVLPLSRVVEAYEKFERGEWGKVVFDPWA
ncbi:uncharacterized protein STEHIDRAFT_52515 [Stereum hirsutum FP-91666 SS1]|uniref:uncharacterized protein n=1 Tax=Stereum hirsutum (strain FP-91666) TaxID=721885 RepID=UPI000440CB24|nr:uncharacterized protein STEHIDRAFT_52515 [Stereum hirsutum FP-91666 SS1]EIM88701.1 hypothetical protein STEHIDRAFT_52515 [Stereum hirsutum FP-91666 SS1]